MKSLLLAAVAAVSLMPAAYAADAYKFALIPKGMDNPYFDLSRDGCMAEAKKIGVTCIYKGPATHEPATEVQIMQDFVTQGVDGIAISVADADSVTGVIKQARDANIPVITFDADAPNSARQAYEGTDNTEMGRELGRQLIKAHPQPSTFRDPVGWSRGPEPQRAPGWPLRGAERRRLDGSEGFALLLQRRCGLGGAAAQRFRHRQPGHRRHHPGRRLGAVRTQGLQGLRRRQHGQGEGRQVPAGHAPTPCRWSCSS